MKFQIPNVWDLGIFCIGGLRGRQISGMLILDMKKLIGIVFVLMGSVCAGEREVWYNAQGEVVKVTSAEKVREAWVPKWKKQELAREEARAARNAGRVRHRGSRYYYAYPRYYGWGGYYSGYYGYHGHRHYGCYSPSRLRFSGSYHGNGWSVHFGR